MGAWTSLLGRLGSIERIDEIGGALFVTSRMSIISWPSPSPSLQIYYMFNLPLSSRMLETCWADAVTV